MEKELIFNKTVESFVYNGFMIEKFYIPMINKKEKILPLRQVKILDKNGKEIAITNCYKKARAIIREKIGFNTFGNIENDVFGKDFKTKQKFIKYGENY